MTLVLGFSISFFNPNCSKDIIFFKLDLKMPPLFSRRDIHAYEVLYKYTSKFL